MAVTGCGDNGPVLPDAPPPIDAPEIDAPMLPTISDVPDQTIDEDGTTGSLGFTVADPMGGSANLTVTASSNNTTVIPTANVVLGGSGANRTVTVTPAANEFGSSTVTLTVTSGSLTASSDFTVTVTSINDLPTISNIPNQTTSEGTATPAIAFTIGDVETAPGTLTLAGSSSNTALVPNGGIVFGGTGANRTVTVTPAATGNGSATITVTVSDGSGSAVDTFDLVVSAPTLVNDPPVNTVPGAQTTDEDVNLVFNPGNNNAITVADVDAAASPLQITLAATGPIGTLNLSGTTGLTFTSGDGTADTSMVFTGSISAINAALNNLTLAVPANGSGTGSISLTTNDQGATGTGGAQTDVDTIAVTINAVNDLPTITPIANQNIAEDTSTSALNFTVGDVETAATALTTTVTSSNPALVPNGNAVIAGTGAARTVTVTPLVDQFGTAIITVRVTDANGGFSESSFTVMVNNANDAPTIVNIPDQSMNLQDQLVVPVTVGDIDNAVGTLSVTASSNNQGVSGLPIVGGSGANRTITFVPTANGSAVITVVVSDGSLMAFDTFNLTVNNINDPPVITVPANQTLQANVNGPANERTFNFNASTEITVVDPDSGANDITVVVAATAGSGTFAITPAVAGLGVSGANTATITLTGTNAEIAAGLRQLDFTSATGFTATTTITVTADDNGNSGTAGPETAGPLSFTINVNGRPTITLLGSTPVTLNEDGTTSLAFQVADPDGTVADITTTANSSNATLLANPVPIANPGAATRNVTITPVANQNNVRAGGPAIVTISASDTEGGNTTSQFTVNVTQQNDAPVLTVPGAQSGDEDGTITVAGISFTDLDLVENPNAVMTMTLTTAGGATSTPIINVTGPGVTGNNSNSVTVVGTLSAINAALGAGVRLSLDDNEYNVPSPPGDSTRSLAITIADGNNGNSSVQSDNDTVNYSFSAVNDAPVFLSGPGIDWLPVNSVRTGMDITLDDIDVHDLSAAAELQVTLSSTDGSLSLTTTTGLVFVTGDGAVDPTIVFRGTLAETLAALNNFEFTPNANFVGDARIQVNVNDQGNFGSGGAKTDDLDIFTTYSVNNTAPTITAIADATIAEDTATPALAFTIADAQTSPTNLTVTATIVASTPGAGSPAGTFVPTLGGSAGNRTISVSSAGNFYGTVEVRVDVFDGETTVSDTFIVTVTPVNDAPTLTPLADVVRNEDFPTETFSYTASDVETPGTLLITVTTDRPDLIAIDNISYNGVNGGTYDLTPASNLFGTANVTVSVSDGLIITQDTYLLTISSVNDLPTVTGSGQIIVNDLESPTLRVRLSTSVGQTITLGTTTGVTFVDVGQLVSLNADGNVDGAGGVNQRVIGIQGTVAALNAAMDDLIVSGGSFDIRVDDLNGSGAVGQDYALGSGIVSTSRTTPFGPNTFGQLVLNLTNNAAPGTGSLLAVPGVTGSATTLVPGFFDSTQPGGSDVGQWNPGLAILANVVSAEIQGNVASRRGWLYDVDLTGQTVQAGEWSATLRLREVLQASTTTGEVFLRVTVVTGTPGALTTVATLTDTDNEGSVLGWKDMDSSTAVGTAVTTVNAGFPDSASHVFATGERLFIEIGFGGASNTTDRTWELTFGDGLSFVTSPE